MLGHGLCHALSFHSQTITHSITNNLPQSKQLLRSLNNGCELLPIVLVIDLRTYILLLIELIIRELKTRTSARIQTTVWIRFIRDDKEGQERVQLAFNSLMTSVYRGSEMDQIVDRMIDNMKLQIENPALLNSRFVFDEFLYLDVNFHQLNLTRGSSYLPLPDWLVRKKAMVSPHNDDEECFKWSLIAAENIGMKDPQRVSNLRNFMDNYNWSRLEFPVSIKDIGKFETRNNISVNVLAVEGRDIYIQRKGQWMMG